MSTWNFLWVVFFRQYVSLLCLVWFPLRFQVLFASIIPRSREFVLLYIFLKQATNPSCVLSTPIFRSSSGDLLVSETWVGVEHGRRTELLARTSRSELGPCSNKAESVSAWTSYASEKTDVHSASYLRSVSLFLPLPSPRCPLHHHCGGGEKPWHHNTPCLACYQRGNYMLMLSKSNCWLQSPLCYSRFCLHGVVLVLRCCSVVIATPATVCTLISLISARELQI